jgi:lysozyme
MSNPKVIDISHYQPDPIDWQQVRAGGTIGVIHKATEGTSYVDDCLFERARAALDAGLAWATYHFLKDNNPEQQMQHYLDTVDPVIGERVCIDHEEKASLDELKQAVQYLQAKRPDLQITIYSGHTIKDQIGTGPESAHDAVLATTSLWLAQYTTGTPNWPENTWPQWSLWQYTDSASVSGINGNVDGNKWNGSDEALVRWFGPPSAVDPSPEPGKVTVAVEGSVDLVVMRDGDQVYP